MALRGIKETTANTFILLNPRPQGRLALIDSEDADRVLLHSWTLTSRGYAITTLYSNKTKKTISLHRFIMNDPPFEVDHRNRDKLDCRKENLRKATRSGNNQNTGKHGANTTSQYKGVCWHRASNKWAAAIRTNGARIRLGLFTDEAEAARSYDRAARQYHGDFAVTNFKEHPAMTATAPLYVREIVYDRTTHDFALYLNSELVGFARSQHEAEVTLDQLLLELISGQPQEEPS